MDARVKVLVDDLRRVFGARLESLVAYGRDDEQDGVHTLALVERLTFQDLAACVPLAAAWRRAGCAVPLLLTRDEFVRTLDVFPVEYGAIISNHVVVAGRDPFAGMQVAEADVRRALELQARSHLIHLREGYMETGGAPGAVARLIAASAPALRALLDNLEPLDPGAAAGAGLTPELAREIAAARDSTIAEPSALLARYIAAVERLWHQVDRWRS